MGNSKRDGFRATAPFGTALTVTHGLLLLHLGALVVQSLDPALTKSMCLSPATLFGEWEWWRLLTGIYFFGDNPGAVLWMCCFLWLFGRKVERIHGPVEFVLFYHAAGAFSGMMWALSGSAHYLGWETLLSTSGAVSGTLALYLLHFPTKILRFAGIVPVPVWILALVYLAGDYLTLPSREPLSLAVPAHLGGVLYALLFKQFHLQWSSLARRVSRRWHAWRVARHRKREQLSNDRSMTVDPQDPEAEEPSNEVELTAQVDALLEKISRCGPEALSEEERKVLGEASRKYRRRLP